jgi:transcriptional regulator with GAF, ATPase, and Fis domain
MATAALLRDSTGSTTPMDLNALLLRLWEAANTQREIQGILVEVADVLGPAVPFRAVSVVSFNTEGLRLHGTHVAHGGTPAPADECSARLRVEADLPSHRATTPFKFSNLERLLVSGKPLSCPDVLARQSWHEHEFHLARDGARAYALQPLIINGKIIGAAIFSRALPEAFSSEQLAILRAVSPAIGVAVANVLEREKATERIAHLEMEIERLRCEGSPRDAREEKYAVQPQHETKDQLLYLRDRMLDAEPLACDEVHQATNMHAKLNDEERKLIETTLSATHGRISGPKGAALRLGLPPSTLEFRIQRLGIDKFRYRRSQHLRAAQA